MPTKPRILLQSPLENLEQIYGKFHSSAGNNIFPYGLACIARVLDTNGYNVNYIEPATEGWGAEEYIQYLNERDYNIIGITATTLQIENALQTVRLIKRHFPHVTTVLGGVHATLMSTEVMADCPELDFVITHEGEKSFLRLVTCISQENLSGICSIPGIVYRDDAGKVCQNDFDIKHNFLAEHELPIPLYEIFPMRRYVAQITFAKEFPSYSIIVGRGCPFRCVFCNGAVTLGKKVRMKPVDVVIDEIKILKEEYGAKGIMFLDSSFTTRREWLSSFCDSYIASGINLPWSCGSRVDTFSREIGLMMKKAGCWGIAFGIESANQKSLDIIDKGTTVENNRKALNTAYDLGFYITSSYIICLPGETERDVMNTIDFSKRNPTHIAMYYLPVPFPKSKLYEICEKDGGIKKTANASNYNCWNFDRLIYVNPLIGEDRMRALFKIAYRQFYSHPPVLLRHFKEFALLRHSPYKLWLGLKAFLTIR